MILLGGFRLKKDSNDRLFLFLKFIWG